MRAAVAARAPASASPGARADAARLRHDPGRGGRPARARRGRAGPCGRRRAGAPHGGVAGWALSRGRVAARSAGHRRCHRAVRRRRSRRVGLRGRHAAVRAHGRRGHLPAAHVGARSALGAAVRCRGAGSGLGRAVAGPRARQRADRPPGSHRRVVPLPRAAGSDAARAAAPARARPRARAPPAREPLACRPRRRRRGDPPCRRRGRRPARGRSAVDQRLPLHPSGPQRHRPPLARSFHRQAGGRVRAAGARGRPCAPGRRRPRSRRALDLRGRPRVRRHAGPAAAAGRRGRCRGDACGDRPRRREAHARRCRTGVRAGSGREPTAIDGSAARGHGVPSARRTRARIRAAGGGITAWRGRRAERQRAVPCPACAARARRRRVGAWPPSSRPARARRSSASGWRPTRR